MFISNNSDAFCSIHIDIFWHGSDESDARNDGESTSTQQQSDWSLVWECFENPQLLLNDGMSRAMQDMVRGAVGEMRRYYSRKIVDVLVKVTRQSLDALRKRFSITGKVLNLE